MVRLMVPTGPRVSAGVWLSRYMDDDMREAFEALRGSSERHAAAAEELHNVVNDHYVEATGRVALGHRQPLRAKYLSRIRAAAQELDEAERDLAQALERFEASYPPDAVQG